MKKEESIDADYLAPAKYDQYNGMRVKEKFGNWDRDAFGPDSRHQLYFCTTKETG